MELVASNTKITIDERLIELRMKEKLSFTLISKQLIEEGYLTSRDSVPTSEWALSRFHAIKHRNPDQLVQKPGPKAR